MMISCMFLTNNSLQEQALKAEDSPADLTGSFYVDESY